MHPRVTWIYVRHDLNSYSIILSACIDTHTRARTHAKLHTNTTIKVLHSFWHYDFLVIVVFSVEFWFFRRVRRHCRCPTYNSYLPFTRYGWWFDSPGNMAVVLFQDHACSMLHIVYAVICIVPYHYNGIASCWWYTVHYLNQTPYETIKKFKDPRLCV